MLAEASQHAMLLGNHRDWGFYQIPCEAQGLEQGRHLRAKGLIKPPQIGML